MKQIHKTNSNFYLSILEREFDIIYSDLKNLVNHSKMDDSLLTETNEFLEDLRLHRRKLNRDWTVLK